MYQVVTVYSNESCQPHSWTLISVCTARSLYGVLMAALAPLSSLPHYVVAPEGPAWPLLGAATGMYALLW